MSDRLSILEKRIAELEKENILLKDQLEFHKIFIENSSGWDTFRDISGRIIYVSPEIEIILGIKREDYLFNKIELLDFIHPEDKYLALDFLKKQQNNEYIHSFTCRLYDIHKNLKYVSIDSKPIFKKNHELLGIKTSIIDITENKLAEFRLKESETQLKEIFDNSLDNIFVVEILENNQFRVKTINSALQSIFNTPKEMIEGKFLKDLVDEASYNMIVSNYNQCIQSGKVFQYEEISNIKNKKVFYSTHLFPLKDANNKIYKLIGISRDVTERKKNELIIKTQNDDLNKLNSDKDRFIQILAHDLKSPYNSLLGFVDLLVNNIRIDDIDSIEKKALIIQQIAHNAYHLLDDLLIWSLSQMNKLRFEPNEIILKDFFDIVLTDYISNSKGIKIKCLIDQQIHCYADTNMLKTIIRNLITNALKFTHKGGLITVSAEYQIENVIITVSDNGIGIEKNKIEKLWKISDLYSTNGTAGEKGSGLGLLICKDFVEKHYGSIWVESKSGKGSTFIFTLPLNIDQFNKSRKLQLLS